MGKGNNVSITITVDDLFARIGRLTVQNDVQGQQLTDAQARIAELEAHQCEAEPVSLPSLRANGWSRDGVPVAGAAPDGAGVSG